MARGGRGRGRNTGVMHSLKIRLQEDFRFPKKEFSGVKSGMLAWRAWAAELS